MSASHKIRTLLLILALVLVLSGLGAVPATAQAQDDLTLTPGYWKTHTRYGPAPYDYTWSFVDPDGEVSVFYLSFQSWYDVLWTAPKGGNPYYILAHQFIAANLNVLNGASPTPSVVDALALADGFFKTYEPSEHFGKFLRTWAIYLADVLGEFNNS